MLDQQLIKQQSRLIKLLQYAKTNVAYYRNIIPKGMDLVKLTSSSEEWAKFPILEKKDIQAHWQNLISIKYQQNNHKPITIRSTSGSTGVPLKIARADSELLMQAVRIWSARTKRFPEIMNKKVFSLNTHPEGDSANILHITKNGVVDFSFQSFDDNIDKIKRFKPEWVYGFSTAVFRFAQYCKSNNIKLPSLQMIEVTGEQLFDYQRKIIHEVFECDVVNQYGCQEVDFLAYECKCNKMHAWTNHLIIEVVKNNKPVPDGTLGELVVTSLTNFCMPLIRYRIGDIVMMEDTNCTCGNKQQILTPKWGRVGSLLTTSERTISSNLLKCIFDDFMGQYENSVLEYQVVQIDFNYMKIYLVPDSKYDKLNTPLGLIKEIKKLLPEVECEVLPVKEIKVSESGKTKRFIPHLPENDMSKLIC
ncbi:phenylacetate--CoA ligase family protein [Vallitalea sp.]|jgi:phenylacetate-CoA ligase|uniref:phenylacetate--CoA ligase family protein n=1 Tax=Vallitalea sp. TaxID=1882829 RepID=UPI0025D206F7|nr:hypothetical protein [Vallitalea sp.]MCT4686738.1 hypothetical protein [Vallitalea sp.]